jgi:hypothetical protein
MIIASEWAKTIHALHRSATMTGMITYLLSFIKYGSRAAI